jgi:hypothetical protein
MAECSAVAGSGSPPTSILDRIDPDVFPHLATLGPALDAADFAAEYDRGLEVLINAVASSVDVSEH